LHAQLAPGLRKLGGNDGIAWPQRLESVAG
jgi:hypothetical protein